MGFLNEGTLSFQKNEFQRRMEEWAREYPFAALMMSNRSRIEKEEYAERMFGKS